MSARDAESWPAPTTDEPDLEQLEEWGWDSVCEATDGCEVEHDGMCPHGHPSWFLVIGIV
jgi:hypothetical protein